VVYRSTCLDGRRIVRRPVGTVGGDFGNDDCTHGNSAGLGGPGERREFRIEFDLKCAKDES
jgi:hypothetical protein